MPFINEEEINGMEPIAIVGMGASKCAPSKSWKLTEHSLSPPRCDRFTLQILADATREAISEDAQGT